MTRLYTFSCEFSAFLYKYWFQSVLFIYLFFISFWILRVISTFIRLNLKLPKWIKFIPDLNPTNCQVYIIKVHTYCWLFSKVHTYRMIILSTSFIFFFQKKKKKNTWEKVKTKERKKMYEHRERNWEKRWETFSNWCNEWTCTESMLIYTSEPKHLKQSLTNQPKYKGISYSTCRD